MVNVDDDGIHPLDRDYSVPSAARKKRFANLSRLQRIGFSVFAAGFTTVVLAAVVLGVFPHGGWFESIGSFMHRLAMYLILVGGVLVLAAYQAPRREAVAAAVAAAAEAEAQQRQRRDPLSEGIATEVAQVRATRPPSRLGMASVAIAAVTIAMTAATLSIWRFGISGQFSMTLLLTLSLLNLVGYPLSLLFSWLAVSQQCYAHVPARIGATVAILGHALLVSSPFHSPNFVLVVIVVAIVACGVAIFNSAKLRSFRTRIPIHARLPQSALGILVAVLAVAWLFVGTLGLVQPRILMIAYSGGLPNIIMLLTCLVAIVSYWQFNRDPYFFGLGAFLIVFLPHLPMTFLALTSSSIAMFLTSILWVVVIGLAFVGFFRRAAVNRI